MVSLGTASCGKDGGEPSFPGVQFRSCQPSLLRLSSEPVRYLKYFASIFFFFFSSLFSAEDKAISLAFSSSEHSNMGRKSQRSNPFIIAPSRCYIHQLEGKNGSVIRSGGCLFCTFYQSSEKFLLNVASPGTVCLKHSSIEPSDLAAILVWPS